MTTGEPRHGHEEVLPALVAGRPPGEPRRAPAPGRPRGVRDVLRRRGGTALAVFAAVVGATLLATFAAVPVYRATALLELPADGTTGRGARALLRTEVDVLKSRTLARRVIERLDLRAEPAFDPLVSVRARATAWLRRLVGREAPAALPTSSVGPDPGQVDRFLAAVTVAPRPDSSLVEVSFRSPSAALAATVTNALAEEYAALGLARRLEAGRRGRASVERQLAASRAALERAETERETFAREEEVFGLDARREVEHKKLADAQESLGRARAEVARKESLAEQVRSGDLARLAQGATAPLTGLVAELARREVERDRVLQTFTAESWGARHLQGQIDALRDRIATERQALAAALDTEIAGARKHETLLAQAVTAQQQVVDDLARRFTDYRLLEREADSARTVYNGLLRRWKTAEAEEGLEASAVQVIDQAEVPVRPVRPRPLFDLTLAVVVGALGGVGAALLRERFDDSIRTPADVERWLGLPSLGAVPELRPRRAGRRLVGLVPELVVAEAPRSMAAEALRTVRAALFLATAAGPPQRILVTSAGPEEGKTCVTTNLGLVLAQMGRRVVLVDCDLRRPRLHRIFGLELDTGVTSFLTDGLEVPALVRPTPYGVDVLPSGPLPRSPVELLDSARMLSLLEELSRRYEFVLLDAPPAVGLADAPLLASLAGGVLFVVRAGETARQAAVDATDTLRRLRARLLGVVLNGVRGADLGAHAVYRYYRDETPTGHLLLRTGGDASAS